MKERTYCFSGHRIISIDKYPKIKKHLKKELAKLINQGIQYFGCGGALGFDTLAALTVISLRKKYPQIKLIMVLPCKEQARSWKEKNT